VLLTNPGQLNPCHRASVIIGWIITAAAAHYSLLLTWVLLSDHVRLKQQSITNSRRICLHTPPYVDNI
jgi:hypothetical protein